MGVVDRADLSGFHYRVSVSDEGTTVPGLSEIGKDPPQIRPIRDPQCCHRIWRVGGLGESMRA